MKRRKTDRAKKVSGHCRNHGLCSWCRGNRLHQAEREEQRAREAVEEVTASTPTSTGVEQ